MTTPCLECLSFCILGRFPPILDSPVPSHFDLPGRLESPFSLSSEVLIVPKLAIPPQPTVLGWHVAGAQSTFAEWINWKWSTVGRMKKVPGDFAIGWTSTSKRLLSDHICTGTPLALSLFLFAQHFYPFLGLGSHRNFTSFQLRGVGMYQFPHL